MLGHCLCGERNVKCVLLFHCEGCMLSKSSNSFPEQSENHTEVGSSFEILHVKLSGPLENLIAFDNLSKHLSVNVQTSQSSHEKSADRSSLSIFPIARKSALLGNSSSLLEDPA